MRKWIWAGVLVWPLLAAGGLVYAHPDSGEAHSGSGETPAAASEKTCCPLQQMGKFLKGVGAKHAAGEKPFCPLQHLLKHLHS
jgi:hypothetical protein